MARATRNSTGTRPAGDPPSSVDDERRFSCTYPGCNKRFTRAEHVQRHALNHTAGQYTCLECRAHFKRPDLLKRHMVRHREKEREADGPGNGILNTRKRSWKTLTGEVVEKRPYPPGQSARRGSFQQDLPTVQDSSPSLETHSSASSLPASILVPSQPEANDSLTQNAPSDFNTQYQQESDQLPDAAAGCDLPLPELPFYDFENFQYEQTFQPDTASSFNMPYTTSLDYNWLFNDISQVPTQQSWGNTFEATTQQPFVNTPETRPNRSISDQRIPYAITPESLDSVDRWVDPAIRNPESIGMASSLMSSEVAHYNPRQVPPHVTTPDTSPEIPSQDGTRKRTKQPFSKAATSTHIIAPEIERPLSMLCKQPEIPSINSETRDRLLSVIESANPCISNEQIPVREHPLLSAHHLNSYLELYFTNFNAAYPLLHLPSFDISTVEPLLLLSVLLLGATYSSKDSHQLAVCIHDVIRPSIFAHAGFSSRPKLWILQTVLLVECFGKSRAGQQQHDMSHLFHGLLINLIRRSDCQSVQTQGPPDDGSDAESVQQAWRKWSEAEQKKRLSLLCFMWDTQHAVLFCQSLCMSSFELRITLPCSQGVWEAPDAPSWAAAWRSSSARDDKTSFLAALKSYLNQGLPRPAMLSSLSRVLLLHGLMSVAWDMERREQTSLGVIADPDSENGWRNSLSTAYDTWKLDFDAHFEASHARGRKNGELGPADNDEAELRDFRTAYNTIYHAAQALLNMEFLDIQIYAGSRHILGRPVQQKDYVRSKQVVKRWAATAWPDASGPQSPNRNCASTAAWHAAHLLSEASGDLPKSRAMGLFHVAWCLYLATLTCWAVHHARPGRGFVDDPYMDSDEIVWDPEGDMKTFISNMANNEPHNTVQPSWQRGTTALAWVMADTLTKIRWGIIHSGVTVLRGLVPQRLINQYEEQT
ncbi:fungal-specific transcription factor domain-containing protein [Nemania sp. FL0916]|nr:fungal-specific transcription factor domain-containing protein [Nemania sp. FL0916]